ncbi:tRNA (carboxymethyluridine(34)-5-O)-methyltransferase [Cytospora mali]|uniref:tRNA (Carboxymethyluridine(34)-5-O)-methyltransferase n=1 Tax=Cytospora mali TaxID=578113 RepID=A0A194WC00_CYTMA|nr:tRNA (carboxymethyluridine(34)-5-O)-methyltransferase [Valsa mali]
MVLTSPPAPPQPSRPGEGPGAVDAYEETHVHGVYEAIAPHFSATRHRPWPFVSSFLASQPPGSVGLDVGCGNGKNMGVNRDVVMLGCDRSAALVGLARDLWCSRRYRRRQHDGDGDDLKEEQKKVEVGVEAEAADGTGGVIQGADVAVADSLVLPFREAGADFAICIAVIHHLSTRERRVDAIRQLLRCIRRRVDEEEEEEDDDDDDDEGDVSGGAGGGGGGGRVLVYVWALEQSSSRRGWDEGGEQDLLVPWVMKAPPQKKEKKEKKTKTKTKTQKKQKKQPKGPNQGQGQGQGRDAVANENTTAAENNLERAGGGVLAGGEDGETLQGQQERQQRQHEQRQEQQQQQQQQDVDAAATAAAGTAERDSDDSKQQQQQQQEDRQADKTFHRYYHLYRKGELEEEVVSAGGKVISSGYERDNWWVIAG